MVGFSRIRGDSAALRVIQQSSAHYFQRPDITEVRYDPTRTSLTGYTFSWRLEKLGGRHWLWDTWGEYESPTFELNDLGRLMSGDDRDFYVDVKYRENRPTRLFYSYNVGLSAKSGWNFGGDRQFSYASVNPAATWRNYLNTWLHAGINAHAMKDDLTRGGPLMRTSLVHDYSGGFSTNERLAASGYGEGDYAYDDLGGWSYALIGGVTARPGGRWSLSVEPRYRRTVEPRQYLATIDSAGGGLVTFGHRYVFSFIERSTLSAQIRLNYLVRPDLTLELYAEPFAASGRYYGFGELAAARTNDLRVYGAEGTTIGRAPDGALLVTDRSARFSLADPDFNVRSFRSNLVLRWEWRRGSTLFVVWQQRRSATDPRGDLVRPRGLWDAVTATGDNFFAVKLTYWLPVS